MSISAELVEISPDGDVILVCGEQFQDGQVKKLKVSSAVLSLGSSVMKAMFKPHFKEGTDLRLNAGSSPLDISLPEDDPLAMEIICYILHLRNDEVDISKDFSLEDILRVAMTSDKYNCHIAMMYPAQKWLDRPHSDEQELHVLFTTAYLFRNSHAFYKLGRGLIGYTSLYSTIALASEYEKDHLLPVLCALDWKRQEIQMRARAAIEEVIDARSDIRTDPEVSHTCIPGCSIAEMCFNGFILGLKRRNLYPLQAIRESTLNQVFGQMQSVYHKPPKEAFACASPDCIGRTTSLGQGWVGCLSYPATHLRSSYGGPCLTCFLEDGYVYLQGCEHWAEPEPSSPKSPWTLLELPTADVPSPPTKPPTSVSAIAQNTTGHRRNLSLP